MRSGRTVALVAGVAASVLLAAGCDSGSEEGGEPTDSAAPAPATPTVAIPPRPREVSVEGVDPCALFTADQLRELKVSRQPRQPVEKNLAPELQGPQCTFPVDEGGRHYDYAIHLLRTEGIEPWLTGLRTVEARLVSVGGFPAVSFYHRTGKVEPRGFSCYTTVGVAEGQQLFITMQRFTNVFSQPELCAMSERAAGLALQTLQTMK